MGIGAVLALIAQGLLSGIGSGTTSWFMGRILTAIAGSASDQQLMNALGDIETELGQISAAIKQVMNAINALAAQLALDITIIQNYIQQAAINEDISIIEDHYSDLQIMNEEAIKQNPLMYTPQDFATLVTGDWDISSHVVAISNALLGNEGLSEGLLNTWTNYFIQSMGPNAAPGVLAGYYSMLQNLFEQQLQHQFKGVALVTSSLGINCDPQKPCQPGLDYLTLQFDVMLAQQVERFIECVERMVLSQYDMTTPSAQLTFPSDGPNVFATADLYSAVTLNQPAGLRGRVITMPTAPASALQPTPAYPSSSGTLVATPSGYKCADWGAMSSVLAYDKSDFQVIRYAWSWPSTLPPAGQPINPSFEGGVAPSYWDTTTYSAVNAPNANTVLYASFTDTSAVSKSLSLFVYGWGSSSNAQPGAETNISPSTSYPSPGGISMAFTLSGDTLWVDPSTYNYSGNQFLTIYYTGSDQQAIEIPFEVVMNFQNYSMTNAMSQTEQFLTSGRATLTANSNLSGNQVLYDSGDLESNANGSAAGALPIMIGPESPVTFTCSVVATANEFHTNYGDIPQGTTVSISLQVNLIGLAWPRPAPGAVAKATTEK
jgi:hypothetical protein